MSGGSPNQQTLLAVAVPALFVAVPILAGVTVAVTVTMAVTVAMSMVSMSIPMTVPMFIVSTSMSMGSMAVTVLVVTVAGLAAARPVLAPFVAVALNASRNRHTPLFGVDLVHASVEHARGEVPTPVLTGGRCLAVLLETDPQCQPGFHIAFIEVTTVLNAFISQLSGKGFASLITSRRLRLFAVVRDTLGIRFSGELDASGFVDISLGAIEALLEHCSGGKLTLTFASRRLWVSAVLCDAIL